MRAVDAEDLTAPSVEVMLEAMHRKNSCCRGWWIRSDYVQIARLSDIDWDELLDLGQRVRRNVVVWE